MTKNNFSLVLTSNKKSFFLKDKNLLLGHWCLQGNDEFLKKIDFTISDFETRYETEDLNHYKENQKIYEELLKDTIKNLSSFYNVSWDTKCWALFIGPWISRYVFLITNRYLSLKYVYENYKIEKISLVENQDFSLITKDLVDFKLKSNDDEWNLKLSSFIWCKYIDPNKKIKRIYVQQEKIRKLQIKESNVKKIPSLSIFVRKFLKVIESWVCKKNRLLFYRSYFADKPLLIKTNFKLQNVPFIYDFDYKIDEVKNLNNLRKSEFNSNISTEIGKILVENFFNFLPTYYLESFSEIKYKFHNLLLPSRPKTVLSSNAIWRDNIFKFWLVQNISSGGRLFTFQHGCNFGTTRISPIEDFEIKLSDKFLTWGWDNNKKRNVKKFFIIKNMKKKLNTSNSKKILLTISSTYNYITGEGTGEIFSRRTKLYQDILYDMINKFPIKFKKYLFIRGNYLGEKLRNSQVTINLKYKFNDSNFQNYRKTFFNSIKDFGLIINSSESTTFLESMSLNKPTISYLDDEIYYNHFRPEALEVYEKLKRVGIVHTNINSLTNFLEKINFNYNAWWSQNETVKAKEMFINSYCRPPKNFVENLKMVIS